MIFPKANHSRDGIGQFETAGRCFAGESAAKSTFFVSLCFVPAAICIAFGAKTGRPRWEGKSAWSRELAQARLRRCVEGR